MNTTESLSPFTTTDATPAVRSLLFLNPNIAFTGMVYVKGITDAGNQIAWQCQVGVRRKLSAAVTLQAGTPLELHDAALSTAAIAMQGGAETLNVQVTGVVGQTIKWSLACAGDITT